jgi:thiamine pyrophosphate-dependent acetolactate synthase large subunit-like protein
LSSINPANKDLIVDLRELVRPPAWKESLKRIRDGEAFDRAIRSQRKNIKDADNERKEGTKKVPEAVVNEASRAIRALAINLDNVGQECTAAYLRGVARITVESLREDA